MSRLLRIHAGLLLLLTLPARGFAQQALLTGCDFQVSPTSIMTSMYGDRYVVEVNTPDPNLPWQVIYDAEWIDVQPLSGVGSGTFSIAVAKQDSSSSPTRESTVWLNDVPISVSQPQGMRFCGSTIYAKPEGFSVPVNLMSLYSREPWIWVGPYSIHFPTTLRFTVTENLGEARSGIVLSQCVTNGARDLYAFQQGHSGSLPLYCLSEFGDIWRGYNTNGILRNEKAGHVGYRHSTSDGWQAIAGDFNGNGLTDFACINSLGELWRAGQLADGSFKNSRAQASETYSYNPDAGDIVFALDADGDGFSDLLQLRGDGTVWLARNNAGIIEMPVSIGMTAFQYQPREGAIALAGRFEGTAREQLLLLDPDGNAQLLFVEPDNSITTIDAGAPGIQYREPEDGSACAASEVLAGDFNGDGITDMLNVRPGNIVWVALGQAGGGFAPAQRWRGPGFRFAPWEGNGWTVHALDINDDGRDDLIQITSKGEAWAARSTGSDFEAPYRAGLLGFHHRRGGPWQIFATGKN